MSTQQHEIRPPLPPFTLETAIEKVRFAEDGWNSRDAAKGAFAYSLDTKWRNRAEFANNRAEAQAFLERKWKATSMLKPGLKCALKAMISCCSVGRAVTMRSVDAVRWKQF